MAGIDSELLVRSPTGEVKKLGPLLASGGEGKIYPLQAHSELLVKWYHPKYQKQRGEELKNKISYMVGLKSKIKPLEKFVCWPQMMVSDIDDRWIGYAMRKAGGIKMSVLAHAIAFQKHFPGIDRRAIVGYLLCLIDTIEKLHSMNILVGDYNLNNILCTPGTSHITLIDCDSYQVVDGSLRYPCHVGSPDMTPKEQHGLPFSLIVRNKESEVFSVAIILFKCLMLGRHPYDIVGGNDPVQNLKEGKFAYGKGGDGGIPRGPWFNIWSHMPSRLKALFIASFKDGANDPARRPPLSEWRDALVLYRKEMDKGWHEVAIRPALPKSPEYRGQIRLDPIS